MKNIFTFICDAVFSISSCSWSLEALKTFFDLMTNHADQNWHESQLKKFDKINLSFEISPRCLCRRRQLWNARKRVNWMEEREERLYSLNPNCRWHETTTTTSTNQENKGKTTTWKVNYRLEICGWEANERARNIVRSDCVFVIVLLSRAQHQRVVSPIEMRRAREMTTKKR